MKIPWHVSLFSADGFQSLLGFIGKWFKQNMWESNEDLSIPFGIYQKLVKQCYKFQLAITFNPFWDLSGSEEECEALFVYLFQSLLGFILLSISSLSTQSQNSFQSLLGFIWYIGEKEMSKIVAFQSLLGFIKGGWDV